MDQRVRDMCLLAFRKHLGSLAIAPFLVAILASPVSAQTSSESWFQRTGPASAPAQSELNRPPTRPTLATPKAGSNTHTAKIIKAVGTQPESNPGTNKAGSAVLINIDKTNQKMTVFLDGVEKYDWPVSTGKAGYSTPSGTYTASSMNEIWYSKQ